MHEKERHRLILAAVQGRPVVTVPEMVELTEASEATIRRDIAALHMAKKLRRVRGGAEAISPPQFVGLAGRPFALNESANLAQKKAIAREAVALCAEGESIIINGGTTTFQMVYPLSGAADADPDQFLRDRRAPAEAVEEHHPAAGRHDLSRADDRAEPVRERRDAEFLRAAHVHGGAGAGGAGADGGRPAADPGRAEADQPGRRAGGAGGRDEVRAAVEPDPVRAGAHRHGDHRRPGGRPRRGDAGRRGGPADRRRRRRRPCRPRAEGRPGHQDRT
jgi:hypothetical protein